MSPIHAILHGHFYQPPRENPWTGRIELQESAAPFHDWNERIAAECYTPNSRSRVLDHQGRVLDVVNNYEHLSFNFGPTLLSYLEEHAPETYARILAADRRAVEGRGFGNAIAQVYNHVIMPLATPRDRWTQICWGLRDFQSRFRRRPEGMWLAETACNATVLEELARAGLCFTILAPSQAEAIRPLSGGDWRDVSAGDIPTGRPYLAHTPAGDIAVFFYDADLSRAVAFEHLLRNAGAFADRIAAAAGRDDPDRFVFVATDGESYGHHEPMGDMCLAFLATRELPRRGLIMTNPAAYLHGHPPEHEVRLKRGQQNLGTAWSCAHGVGRWREDCGCTTGGPASWNQAWRTPLRTAFDALRAEIDPLFEEQGGRSLRDPWAARDDYIRVLLGRPVGAVRWFFERHARRPLSDPERAEVFRLLEMQHNGLLMYTSCGWFFSDLAGIEALQNLRYFARAAQLGERIAGRPIDGAARILLAQAHSNLASQGSGLDLLRRAVAPTMLSPGRVAAHQAIRAMVEGQAVAKRLYGFRLEVHTEEHRHGSAVDVLLGRMTVSAERTGEGGTFEVAVLASSELKVQAFVRPYSDGVQSAEALLGLAERDGFEAATDLLTARFGEALGLADMLPELRLLVIEQRIRPVLDELGGTLDDLYIRHERLLQALGPLGVGLPEALAPIVGFAASRRLEQLVERGLSKGDLSAAVELSHLTQVLGIDLKRRRASRLFSTDLAARLKRVLAEPAHAALTELLVLLDTSRAMRLEVDEAPLQDAIAEALQPALAALLAPEQPSGPQTQTARALLQLAGYLNLNVERFAGQLSAALG